MKTYKYKVLAIYNDISHLQHDLGSYNRAVAKKDIAIAAARKFQTRFACDVIVEKHTYVDGILIGFETVFNANHEERNELRTIGNAIQ
jgi:molybdopterin-guanine dinucleotide biosynthesis protein A